MDLFKFDKILISEFLEKGYFDWRLHALERAAERSISQDKVLEILRQWDVLEKEYNRKPFPTALVIGWNGQQPIHVVVAIDEALEWVYIITVYEPDLDHFEPGFRARKKP